MINVGNCIRSNRDNCRYIPISKLFHFYSKLKNRESQQNFRHPLPLFFFSFFLGPVSSRLKAVSYKKILFGDIEEKSHGRLFRHTSKSTITIIIATMTLRNYLSYYIRSSKALIMVVNFPKIRLVSNIYLQRT